MLPVRCFTCNKVLGRYDGVLSKFHDEYPDEEQKPWEEFFDRFNIQRYCCRKILLTHVDIFKHSVPFMVENVKSKEDLEVQLLLNTD